jgi:hypothetical protein
MWLLLSGGEALSSSLCDSPDACTAILSVFKNYGANNETLAASVSTKYTPYLGY